MCCFLKFNLLVFSLLNDEGVEIMRRVEPSELNLCLEALLADPLIRLVMASDGISQAEARRAWQVACRAIGGQGGRMTNPLEWEPGKTS